MAGMLFGNPRTPDEEERDLRTQALEYARLTPEQQISMDSIRGNQLMSRGIQQLGGAALGVDTRSAGEQRREHEQMAQKEIAALEIDPNDIDRYYPAVIQILRKHGLTDAMNAIVEKFRDHKLKTEDQKIKRAEVDRKTAADTQRYQTALAKIEVDQAKAARMGAAAMQLIGQINAMQAQASDLLDSDPRKEQIAKNIEDLKRSLEVELAKNKFKMQAAGNRMVIIDQTTGETKEGPEIGAKPPTAKEEKAEKGVRDQAEAGIRQAQSDIANAVRLYQHKGLPGITGAIYGRTPSVTDASMSAMALYDQVQAGTFLAALRALKGPENKPTGLGQLTEVEGQKIQSAMAALSRVQSTESFRYNLEKYIRQVESSIQVLAKAVGAPVIEEPVKLPAAGGPEAKKTVKAPAAKPAAAPAAGGAITFERGPDGKIKRK